MGHRLCCNCALESHTRGLQVYALRQAYAEARDSSEGLGSEVNRLQREVENLRSQLQRASSTSLRQVRLSVAYIC